MFEALEIGKISIGWLVPAYRVRFLSLSFIITHRPIVTMISDFWLNHHSNNNNNNNVTLFRFFLPRSDTNQRRVLDMQLKSTT